VSHRTLGSERALATQIADQTPEIRNNGRHNFRLCVVHFYGRNTVDLPQANLLLISLFLLPKIPLLRSPRVARHNSNS
jgi:hypothetical protein